MARFEELEVWKKSTRLSVEIYKSLVDLKDYGFRDQITRSSLSVPSNIAEGYERNADKELANFLNWDGNRLHQTGDWKHMATGNRRNFENATWPYLHHQSTDQILNLMPCPFSLEPYLS